MKPQIEALESRQLLSSTSGVNLDHCVLPPTNATAPIFQVVGATERPGAFTRKRHSASLNSFSVSFTTSGTTGAPRQNGTTDMSGTTPAARQGGTLDISGTTTASRQGNTPDISGTTSAGTSGAPDISGSRLNASNNSSSGFSGSSAFSSFSASSFVSFFGGSVVVFF